jgi:hypothetical protein
MIDYSLILSTKYAGSEWTLNGDDYEGLTWLSDSKKPTKEELDSQWESAIAQRDAEIQAKADAKTALLTRLGITEDEAKLLLG